MSGRPLLKWESSIGVSSKRVLVTSGAGFLGSHLCGQLLNQGCKVLCVDNFTYP